MAKPDRPTRLSIEMRLFMKIHLEFWFDATETDGCYWRGCNMPPYLCDEFANWWHIARENSEAEMLRHSNIDFELPIDDHTTFQQVFYWIVEYIGADQEIVAYSIPFLHILVGDDLIYIDRMDVTLAELWRFVQRPDTLHCIFIFSTLQGDVYREDNLRFYLHSNEQGHNEAHVHVCIGNDWDNAISVKISDCTILAGHQPRGKTWRKIQSIIIDHRDEFMQAWEMRTNGFSRDMNYRLGLVH